MLYKHLALGIMCVGVLVGNGCKRAVPDSELVAKVNGKGISKAEFETMVERNMARYRGHGHTLPPGIESRIKDSVLRRMIDDKVIGLKAEAINVGVSDAELEQKFKDHKDRFRTEQAFQDYLKRSKNTAEAMKADLRRNMLRDRVVENLSGAIEISDADVSKYYEENQKRFVEKEQVKAARIVIKADVPPGAPRDLKSAQKKAEALAREVFRKATGNGADFNALAAEYSMGPEKNRRGELGWLTRGRMPPAFDNVAFGLEPNQISEPVRIKDAWEIIRISEKRPERQRSLDQVKENIRNSLLARRRNEKRRDVLRTLKKDAKVEHLISFDRTTPARPSAMPPKTGPGGRPDLRTPRPPRPITGQPPGAPTRPSNEAMGTAPVPKATPPLPPDVKPESATQQD